MEAWAAARERSIIITCWEFIIRGSCSPRLDMMPHAAGTGQQLSAAIAQQLFL